MFNLLKRLGEFLVVLFLFFQPVVLSTTIFKVFEDTNVLDNFNCNISEKDSRRFSLKRNGINYELSDLCNGINLTSLKYFPKCCPLGYSYKSETHSCFENNLSNIYDQLNILVKSFLDCPVIIDNFINNEELITFDKNSSVTFNKRTYQIGYYCIDWDFTKSSSILRTCEKIDECKSKRCITKCCKDGFSYSRQKCIWNPEFGVSIKNITRFDNQRDSFSGIVQAKKCKRFIDKPDIDFKIKTDGGLLIKEMNKWNEYAFEQKMYCLEYLPAKKIYAIFICGYEGEDIADYKICLLKTLNIISCISLILTILGYLFLKELKNFVGKIVIFYCVCILIRTLLLTYSQFNPNQQEACIPLGFLAMFFILSAFAWMNLLSFEIWHTLGSMMTHYGTSLYNERKKIIYYNIYAWSGPVLLLTLAMISYYTEIIPDNLSPVIGLTKCFIETDLNKNYGYYIFVAIPILIYIIVNFVFFIQTIHYIFKVKKDLKDALKNSIGTKQKRFHLDKDRTIMVFRIFIIMGITWLFEFIQAIQKDFSKHIILKIIELFFDIFNALQGFLIFYVFMVKRTIWIALKRKFHQQSNSRLNSTIAIGSTQN